MDSCHLGLTEHASGNDQIGQGKETVKLGEIFPQPPVSNLPVSEEVFDDVEGMLHLGSYLRLPAFPFPQQVLLQPLGQRLDLPLLLCHQPLNLVSFKFIPLLNPNISRIGVHPLLFPMQEILGLADVTDIGGGGHKAMH